MELLKWTMYYLVLVTASVSLAVVGWKVGARLKAAQRAARHNKDMKVIQDFEGSEDI